MISFNLSEAQAISFEMSIDGRIKNVDSVSLIIESGQGYQIKIPATYDKDEKTVTANVPVLEGVLTEGEKGIKLELVVDGKFYTPLEESILVEAPIKIQSKIHESTPVVEKEVAVPEIKVSLGKLISKDIKTITGK